MTKHSLKVTQPFSLFYILHHRFQHHKLHKFKKKKIIKNKLRISVSIFKLSSTNSQKYIDSEFALSEQFYSSEDVA